MTKTATAPVQAKREVGERVKLVLSFDSEKTKELADGVFETIITTNAVDRYSEVIDPSGIDTSSYMNNPVVLYGHDYEGLPIGKTLKLTQQAKKWKAQFQLAVEEYPFAATVAALIKGGYLNAVSIGGIVRQWSDDYKTIEKLEMVEFSVVPVPANPEALITGRSFAAAVKEATGKDIEDVREEFADFSHKVFVDKLEGMPQDEVIDAVKVLENLVARLKETAETPSLADDKPTKRVKHFVLKDAKAVAEQSQRVIKTIKLSA